MSKKTNQPNMICPCCGGREFITTVTVTQDWRVSFGGDFLEEVSSCNDVLREPDTDNIWSCFRCEKRIFYLRYSAGILDNSITEMKAGRFFDRQPFPRGFSAPITQFPQ